MSYLNVPRCSDESADQLRRKTLQGNRSNQYARNPLYVGSL